MKNLIDTLQIATGFKPVDIGTAGAAADYVSLKNYGSALFVLQKNAGVTAEDATLTLSQATSVAGGGKKALNFARYAYKTGTDLLEQGTFTHVTNNATNTLSVLGVSEALIVIEINGDDLDADNAFDCVIAELSDPGTTGVLASGLWILGNPRSLQTPMPSAIVD